MSGSIHTSLSSQAPDREASPWPSRNRGRIATTGATLLSCLLSLPCLAGGPRPAGAGQAAGAAVPAPARGDLAAQMAAIALDARGRVGAAAMVLETGEAAGLHDAGRFPMQSVYKLPIAMAVLRAVDAGTLRLEQPVAVRPEDVVPVSLHSPLRDRFFVSAPPSPPRAPATPPAGGPSPATPAAPPANGTASASPPWRAACSRGGDGHVQRSRPGGL